MNLQFISNINWPVQYVCSWDELKKKDSSLELELELILSDFKNNVLHVPNIWQAIKIFTSD